jgi:peptidoglycan/xylan/chitin deacetylase (PgdA/CDA1 family)/glycosyltransferase involved in cell wall biosynthesis
LCLEAISSQTYAPGGFEVVVVVDGSTDDTMDTLRAFRSHVRLRTVWQENAGQASALNHGIRLASGRYCLFLDDDIVAAPELIAAHVECQRAARDLVGIGRLRLSLPRRPGWYLQAFADIWEDDYEGRGRDHRAPTWEHCYSGNMSVRRDTLRRVGGFREDVARGYDLELGHRLMEHGCTFAYVPTAVGVQHERKGFQELSRDAERAGGADVVFYASGRRMLSTALGSFAAGSWRKLLLKRALLAVHVPPKLLELAGRLLWNRHRKKSWHAFIQHVCYWRGVKEASSAELWACLTSGTPILMYHAVGAPGEPPSQFVIPSARLAAQVAWLQRRGYLVISLREFLECQRQRILPPPRSVVITFDDGYADNYSTAVPILRRRDMAATIFLVAEHVGGTNQWDAGGALAGRRLMSWPQIRELSGRSIEFGAHSSTHPRLTQVPAQQAAQEIASSRGRLEEELCSRVDVFAYPYGDHDQSIQEEVRRAGFTAACSVDVGLNSATTPQFVLRRAEIQGTDSMLRFRLAVWFGDPEAIIRRRPSRTLAAEKQVAARAEVAT